MSQYRLPDALFDAERGLLNRDDEEIHVRHKVAQLIAFLIEQRQRVVSKEELLNALWQHGEYRENSLTQSVREARRLLGDSAQQPQFIKNYPQRGYQWIAEVQLLETEETTPVTDSVPGVHDNATGEPPVETRAAPAVIPKRRWRPWLVAMLIGASALPVYYGTQLLWPASPVQASQQQRQTPHLLVLPFLNDTGDPSLQWMEMGLSDMLATALGQSEHLDITPPAQSHNLLAVEGLEWPPTPARLQPLMQQHGLDLLLLSRVTLYRGQQVLNMRLYKADGSVVQGSISYPQLAEAISAVSAQLQQLIDPQRAVIAAPELDIHPASLQDLVRGLQALQQQGAPLAQQYFDAALLQDRSNQWALAYGAMTRLQQGQWQQALDRLAQIDTSGDSGLSHFICRWQAEVTFRRGQLNAAQRQLQRCAKEAHSTGDQRIEYQSYRLLAQIAHQRLAWPTYRNWNRRATELVGANGDLTIQAERLFYLGTPVESGLEKNPYNDLLQNAPRLKQALQYFQRLGNQPMIAATRFALAQNYTLPLAERESSLTEAITLWRSLNAPFELAQALTYQGFYHLQIHQGEKAVAPLEEAIDLASRLGARWLEGIARLYRAFADLDMGLDRGTGSDPVALQRALLGFDRLLKAPDLAPKERADSHLLRSWALSELGRREQAIESQRRARDYYRRNSLKISFGYAIYSMMWDLLQQDRVTRVIELGEEPVQTRLQLRYLAEAYHRRQDYPSALAALGRIKTEFAASWTPADQQRYEQYRQTPQRGIGPLPSPHLVYCETDWLLDTPPVAGLRP